ncbi:hypothetical protein F4703DRAFT_1797200 [Phycomyces blakesleeanus]
MSNYIKHFNRRLFHRSILSLQVRMASTLPPNILTFIATHVDQNDQIACALVCRQWTEPFVNAYWGTLNINNHRIKTLAEASNFKDVYKRNAHRVWALKLDSLKQENMKRLTDLQKVYPGIKYLEYNETNQETNWITESINWRLWSSLSHLVMMLTCKTESNIWEKLFINLSALSNLVHLTLSPSANNQSLTKFLWADNEALYHHLPLLKYLRVDYVLMPIPIEDMPVIRSITPAHSITKINYSDYYMDTLWIFYFALKYPSLHNFTIKETSYKNPREYANDNQEYQNGLQVLSTLNQFFPCLKKTIMPTRSCNAWPLSIFYDTLQNFNTKIEHTEFIFDGNTTNIIDDLNMCISPISASLKVMRIDMFNYPKYQPTIFISNLCPNLVELHVHLFRFLVDIKHILNQCPVLQSLYIKKSTVNLTNHPQNINTPHSLQKLEIEEASTGIHIFNYISFRCKQLKFLKLNNVELLDSNWEKTGQVLLDMSSLQLETLILRNIILDFYAVKHCVIEQIEKADINISSQSHQKLSIRSNWYHVCLDKTNRKKRLLAWELGRRDIEFAQRYYKNFSRRRLREGGRKDMLRYSGYVLKRFWKRDLQNGALTLQFRSVKSYFLDMKKEIDDEGDQTKFDDKAYYSEQDQI